MTRTLAPAILTTAALLAFAETANAGGYYDRDHSRGDIQCIRAPCYPARERPRWDRWDRGDHWDRGHGWGRRVVVRRGGWDRHDDCHTVVKRRVNHWGEVITERTRVCY